jgi:hypothetical protein
MELFMTGFSEEGSTYSAAQRGDFRPASGGILPNRKNKRRSSRQALDAEAFGSYSIRKKIGMHRSASFLVWRNRRQGTRTQSQEELRS